MCVGGLTEDAVALVADVDPDVAVAVEGAVGQLQHRLHQRLLHAPPHKVVNQSAHPHLPPHPAPKSSTSRHLPPPSARGALARLDTARRRRLRPPCRSGHGLPGVCGPLAVNSVSPHLLLSLSWCVCGPLASNSVSPDPVPVLRPRGMVFARLDVEGHVLERLVRDPVLRLPRAPHPPVPAPLLDVRGGASGSLPPWGTAAWLLTPCRLSGAPPPPPLPPSSPRPSGSTVARLRLAADRAGQFSLDCGPTPPRRRPGR